MTASQESAVRGCLAIDVGSSRVKLGWFPPAGECSSDKSATGLPIAAPKLPQPDETLAVAHGDQATLWATVGAWLQEFCPTGPPGWIASVHPPALAIVQEMFAHRLRLVVADDLPLAIRVEQPEGVGIDRLLNAVAVNRLRQPERAAIVVDMGTACTVDFVAPDGAFEGGAILPGILLAASSLHAGTASLPELTADRFDTPPELVGKSTQEAIAAGIYWGTIGAVREIVARMSSKCKQAPQLFFTGGGATQLAEQLTFEDQPSRHIPNLVLSGMAIVAEGGS